MGRLVRVWTKETVPSQHASKIPVGDYFFDGSDFYLRTDYSVGRRYWQYVTNPLTIEGLKELLQLSDPPDLDYVRESFGLPEGTEL